MRIRELLSSAVLLALFHSGIAAAQVPFSCYPTFKMRAHVLTVGGKAPDPAQTFTFKSLNSYSVQGTKWTDWMPFGLNEFNGPLAAETVDLNGFPLQVGLIVTPLSSDPVGSPTKVEIQITFDENNQTTTLSGEPFGTFGVYMAIWRDGQACSSPVGSPHAGTLADYNRIHYWDPLKNAGLQPDTQRAQKFVLIDTFRGWDADLINWQEGISNLFGLTGSNVEGIAYVDPGHAHIADVVRNAGVHRFAGGVAWPVASRVSALDMNADGTLVSDATIQSWAQQQATTYLNTGFSLGDVAFYQLCNEPTYGLPNTLLSSPSSANMQWFQQYLQKPQNTSNVTLTPNALGYSSWNNVLPLEDAATVSTANAPLTQRRLFYWTTRFFAWDSTHYFNRITQALQSAFQPQLLLPVDWNNWNNRYYTPPLLNDNDWLEYGHSGVSTMLMTDALSNDASAFAWSYYGAELRSAARQLNPLRYIPFGGIVVGLHSGQIPGGIAQQALSLVGSGAKIIDYYSFGPNYAWPSAEDDVYSANMLKIIPEIAAANHFIAASEDVLWAGQHPLSSVAILSPRSSEPWDARHKNIGGNGDTLAGANEAGYIMEKEYLYYALMHANIPAEFLDEDDLTNTTFLNSFKVIYITEPNVPIEGQTALANWVKQAGHVLVLCPQGALLDRYDDPSTALAAATGIQEPTSPPDHFLFMPQLASGGNTNPVHLSFSVTDQQGRTFSVLDKFTFSKVPAGAQTLATFSDHSPAIVHVSLGAGKGDVVAYAYTPGVSYIESWTSRNANNIVTGFSDVLRQWAIYPTTLGGIVAPVSVGVPLLETPVLTSSQGTAVIVLNWTGQPLTQSLNVVVNNVNFTVKHVDGVNSCQVAFKQQGKQVSFSLPPVATSEVVTLRP